MAEVKPDKTLDVRGMVCPYPQVYALRELASMEDGQVLEILTDHLPSTENVPRAVEREGHEVLGVEKVGAGVYKILVRARRRK